MLKKEEVFNYLDELKDFYNKELTDTRKKIEESEYTLKNLDRLVDAESNSEFKNFLINLKTSLHEKLPQQLNKKEAYENRLPKLEAIRPLFENKTMLDIYTQISIMEQFGLPLGNSQKGFTKEEYLQNLKILSDERKLKLEEAEKIIVENDIALKELRNKIWSKEAKPLFERMGKNLELVNMKQRPEIKNYKKILKAIDKLIGLINANPHNVDLLTVIVSTLS